MEEQLFKNVPPKERKQYLMETAVKVDQQFYYRQLTAEERSQRQENLVKVQTEIMQTEQEKSETVKQYNEALKDRKERNVHLVQELKMNATEIEGEVFFIPDEDSRQMGIYNAEGKLISKRPLYADEMQQSIFSLQKSQ